MAKAAVRRVGVCIVVERVLTKYAASVLELRSSLAEENKRIEEVSEAWLLTVKLMDDEMLQITEMGEVSYVCILQALEQTFSS